MIVVPKHFVQCSGILPDVEPQAVELPLTSLAKSSAPPSLRDRPRGVLNEPRNIFDSCLLRFAFVHCGGQGQYVAPSRSSREAVLNSV